MGNKKVMWYEVYRELAELLVQLDSEEKREKFFYDCISNKEFVRLNSWSKNFFEKSKIQTPVGSFDPLQIFASFNGFGMRDSVRKDKINLYFKLLGSERSSSDKEIDFSGCPTPMMLHLVAIRTREGWKAEANVVLEKEKEAQGKIWEAFTTIVNNQSYSSEQFEDLKTVFGVTLNSFSMLLFWIDSRNFLPLDKNTLALFETNNQNIDKKIKTWEEYLKFLKPKDTDIYQTITFMAWEGCSYESFSDETKEKLKEEFYITRCPNKSLKIIAIKPLEGCNKKFLKGLKEEQLYLFDKAYSIGEDGLIKYDKENDIQLFNQSDLQVNINAIVGRNGTGKSTLVELLLATINNLNFKQMDKSCISYIENLKVELIFEDLNIYKVILDKEIQLFEYDNKWKKIKKFINQKQFFYNILVNYSIHSLDSSENSWIEPHFDNDCSTDIMIEPFRENGNINIQEEEKRVKQRLIVNLLESTDNMEDEYNHRQLTHNFEAKKFIAKLKKGKKRTEIFKQIYKEEYDEKTRTAEYSINDLSGRIAEVKKEYETIDKYILDNYIDDIILENDIKFSQLSSGEKQKIYSINSILYHIREIDRKKKHKHINLILDEIELYFHPELQRTYISDIIKAIKKVGTENILGINITFITHSPFILSDIPKSKILFLEKDSHGLTVPKDINGNTFGANIHTLLSGSFFMENGLIGEFAKGEIDGIKKFYEKVIEEKKTDENIEFYGEHQDKFWQIQKIIGEPFLQKIVKNQLEEIELILLGRDEAIDNEMARLQALKESLKK